ncbi:hypothetical protein APS56_04820 [Pseudalgibacter alginicilyticus]|uniref:Uncharacterized protein n=1 Tax=Pseudalgibacter alginicilyticus TaxID=1736674 RepID=A0A0N7HY79_9FLAO|nr:hypothetical protein [Pseudalgibacter alginicilyticus]ALJ04502.1 hypothetical protein APS56_04820 [Pseudalgibacter alginicilyticus]
MLLLNLNEQVYISYLEQIVDEEEGIIKSGFKVENANSTTIYITEATDYNFENPYKAVKVQLIEYHHLHTKKYKKGILKIIKKQTTSMALPRGGSFNITKQIATSILRSSIRMKDKCFHNWVRVFRHIPYI